MATTKSYLGLMKTSRVVMAKITKILSMLNKKYLEIKRLLFISNQVTLTMQKLPWKHEDPSWEGFPYIPMLPLIKSFSEKLYLLKSGKRLLIQWHTRV